MQVNIYCDESCHLEHDGQPVMVLGAVVCPREKAHGIAERLREIKSKHGVARNTEIKWGKVSPSKLDLYMDVVDFFFDDDDLSFRAIVADKSQLDHDGFAQSHDDWYYKMYYQLLNKMLSPAKRYRIFLDIKDTRGAAKCERLRDILCNNMLDFDRNIVNLLQNVRSHEVEQVQLADLLAGAVGYANRKLQTSTAKLALVDRVRKRSHYSLLSSTLLLEPKFNLFHWKGRSTSHNG